MLLLNFSLHRFRIRLIKKNTKQERTETQMKLGEKQTLTVVKQVDFGVYLAEQPEDETRVLLPAETGSGRNKTARQAGSLLI